MNDTWMLACFMNARTASGVPRGGFGGSNPPPPKFRSFDKSNRIAYERKMFSVPIPNILISLKIAGFRMPTPQDVRKKGSKILKLPRFAIVLHLQ